MKKIYDLIMRISDDPFWKWPAGILVFFLWIWLAYFVIELLRGGITAFYETSIAMIGLLLIVYELIKGSFLWLYYNGVIGVGVLIFLVYILVKKIKKLVKFLASKKK